MRSCLLATGIALMLAGTSPAKAETAPYVVTLTLKDHRFTPEVLVVPAGQKIRVDLVNRDAATEEFDSEDLHVEKDVTPHGKVSFLVGPLAPGTYGFMGELHSDTANGSIKAVVAP